VPLVVICRCSNLSNISLSFAMLGMPAVWVVRRQPHRHHITALRS
jgi:hypothetical protein